jgi:hypothetical protein
MVKRGFLIAVSAPDSPRRIVITKTGRAAIADEAGEPETVLDAAPEVAAVPPPTKLGVIIELLQRPKGATVEELMVATGWHAHWVRAAISGALRKKLKHIVLSKKSAAGRTYRIPAPRTGGG